MVTVHSDNIAKHVQVRIYLIVSVKKSLHVRTITEKVMDRKFSPLVAQLRSHEILQPIFFKDKPALADRAVEVGRDTATRLQERCGPTGNNTNNCKHLYRI